MLDTARVKAGRHTVKMSTLWIFNIILLNYFSGDGDNFSQCNLLPYTVLWLNVWNKELFWGDQKVSFKAKFDCIIFLFVYLWQISNLRLIIKAKNSPFASRYGKVGIPESYDAHKFLSTTLPVHLLHRWTGRIGLLVLCTNARALWFDVHTLICLISVQQIINLTSKICVLIILI